MSDIGSGGVGSEPAAQSGLPGTTGDLDGRWPARAVFWMYAGASPFWLYAVGAVIGVVWLPSAFASLYATPATMTLYTLTIVFLIAMGLMFHWSRWQARIASVFLERQAQKIGRPAAELIGRASEPAIRRRLFPFLALRAWAGVVLVSSSALMLGTLWLSYGAQEKWFGEPSTKPTNPWLGDSVPWRAEAHLLHSAVSALPLVNESTTPSDPWLYPRSDGTRWITIAFLAILALVVIRGALFWWKLRDPRNWKDYVERLELRPILSTVDQRAADAGSPEVS
jgi:hypothetical protein